MKRFTDREESGMLIRDVCEDVEIYWDWQSIIAVAITLMAIVAVIVWSII